MLPTGVDAEGRITFEQATPDLVTPPAIRKEPSQFNFHRDAFTFVHPPLSPEQIDAAIDRINRMRQGSFFSGGEKCGETINVKLPERYRK